MATGCSREPRAGCTYGRCWPRGSLRRSDCGGAFYSRGDGPTWLVFGFGGGPVGLLVSGAVMFVILSCRAPGSFPASFSQKIVRASPGERARTRTTSVVFLPGWMLNGANMTILAFAPE